MGDSDISLKSKPLKIYERVNNRQYHTLQKKLRKITIGYSKKTIHDFRIVVTSPSLKFNTKEKQVLANDFGC